jgi:hypothetical protein
MNERARPIWRETAEVIGVLGVVGSVIFVALEIRQNTDAVRSATIQAISEQSFDSNFRLAENPDLLALMLKADNQEPLTDSERFQLFTLLNAILRLNQNRYQQFRLGVLDTATLFEVGGRSSVYQGFIFAEYWEETKQNHSVEFQRFIEECVISECDAVPL